METIDGKKGRAKRTHCKAGHAYTKQNTYQRRDGSRACVECQRDRDSRRYGRSRLFR
jgi:hypothetical protein